MKRFVCATLAMALLGSTTAAIAQPDNHNYSDQNNNRVESDRNGVDRNNNYGADNGRNDRERNDQSQNDRNANRDRGDQRDQVRNGDPRWSRGDRLPDQYRQNQYVANDWQQHGLRQPPRGYHWVRNDNNDFFLAAISSGIISEVASRDERDQKWRQRYAGTSTYSDDSYYRDCRTAPDPAGVIAGGLIGGLLGNAIGSGGGRTGATVAGVIVGGAVGAALTNNLSCEDRSYAYKTYSDGFNAGRSNATYQWQNPRDDHRGQFRVGTYYNDPAGFRCANYTQSIYVQGRAQQASGKACRQPDGTWVIVS